MDLCLVSRSYVTIVTTEGVSNFVFKNSVGKHNYVHPIVMKWFSSEIKNDESILHGCDVIELFSEYKRHEILYQAHHNYQSMGPWYDWVMVTFASEYCEGTQQHNVS